MKARDIYELRHEPPPRLTSWPRRLSQILAFFATMGEPMTKGGASTMIVERESGRVVGKVLQRFGDEFYDVPLKEDLATLDEAEFEEKWLTR